MPEGLAAVSRFFDPRHYRAVLFDQRGCGRSSPHASVENNTTWDLVADIERIRIDLGIERWVVFGGSWGACLALIYAQTHPERVSALVLRGVFTMTRAELDWFYGGGAGAFWPEQWRAFAHMVPREERGDLIAAYHKRLFGPDAAEQTRFARAWAGWESALAVLEPGEGRGNPSSAYALAFARLENHYFTNGGFLDGDPAPDRPCRPPGLARLGPAHGPDRRPRAVRARHHGRTRGDHGRIARLIRGIGRPRRRSRKTPHDTAVLNRFIRRLFPLEPLRSTTGDRPRAGEKRPSMGAVRRWPCVPHGWTGFQGNAATERRSARQRKIVLP